MNIIDSGVGIKKENLNVIFNRFEQIHDEQINENLGSGLGLFITKGILEKIGGDIKIESEYGKGSNFQVRIKKVKFEKIESSSSQRNSNSVTDISFIDNKILRAEDLENNIKLLKAFLEPYRLEIETARNGLELIQKAANFKPNLIITDIKMPNMDGMEAKKKLELLEETKNIPIIALSAVLSEEDIISPFDGFLKSLLVKKNLLRKFQNF